MTRNLFSPLHIVVAGMLLPTLWGCACKDHNSADVPLPYAYPRIAVADTTYTTVEANGVLLEVNQTATVARKSHKWLDVAYPSYEGTLHLSVNSFENKVELEDAVANRLQRINLDLGENYATMSTFCNAHGFDCRLIESDGSSLTPVHLVATHPGNLIMVSGTFALRNAVANADSLAPVVRAVSTDAMHTLRSLRKNEP